MRLTGAAIFSAHPKTLSRAAGLLAVVVVVVAGAVVVAVAGTAEVDLGRSHDGRNAETRCIVNRQHPPSSTGIGEEDQGNRAWRAMWLRRRR